MQPSPLTDVRMRGFRDRADIQDVLRLITQRTQPLPPEDVPLREAAGRVLAAEVVAPFAVPGFDRAAMDGYALKGEETFGAGPYNPIAFRLIGESRPGSPFSGTVGSFEAVRIMTGAALPAGADSVLMAESAHEQDRQITATEAVPPGRHVGHRGEDIQAGTVVLPAGRVLRPQDLGVLASIGTAQVPVYRQPVVSILITGDELLPPGSPPDGAKIVDSNSVMLDALARRDSGIPRSGPIIPDRRELLREALLDAAATSDCILISGGSSVGPEDHAPSLVAELGELPIHGVAMRPSSPAGLGFLPRQSPTTHHPPDTRHQTPATAHHSPPTDPRSTIHNPRSIPTFLLPGNPVSCLCAYDFFAAPAIRRLGGRSMNWPYRTVELPLARKLVSVVGRVDYARVQVTDGQVHPLATSGASILSSTTRADGFVIIPKDSEGHPPGQAVKVFLYD